MSFTRALRRVIENRKLADKQPGPPRRREWHPPSFGTNQTGTKAARSVQALLGHSEEADRVLQAIERLYADRRLSDEAKAADGELLARAHVERHRDLMLDAATAVRERLLELHEIALQARLAQAKRTISATDAAELRAVLQSMPAPDRSKWLREHIGDPALISAFAQIHPLARSLAFHAAGIDEQSFEDAVPPPEASLAGTTAVEYAAFQDAMTAIVSAHAIELESAVGVHVITNPHGPIAEFRLGLRDALVAFNGAEQSSRTKKLDVLRDESALVKDGVVSSRTDAATKSKGKPKKLEAVVGDVEPELVGELEDVDEPAPAA